MTREYFWVSTRIKCRGQSIDWWPHEFHWHH